MKKNGEHLNDFPVYILFRDSSCCYIRTYLAQLGKQNEENTHWIGTIDHSWVVKYWERLHTLVKRHMIFNLAINYPEDYYSNHSMVVSLQECKVGVEIKSLKMLRIL